MKKQDLKFITPYLPYKLLGKYLLSDVLKHVAYGGIRDELRNKMLTSENVEFFVRYCKPILHPITDIKETICINNEPFVPINELAIELYNREPESFDCQNSCIAWIQTMVYDKVIEPKGYDDIPHWIYQDLIKWHFDVFHLIPENLAIDINTI